MRKVLFVMFLAAVLGFSTLAHATLTIVGSYNGNNLIYQNDSLDPDNPLKGITWYDYTNSPDTWASQKSWALHLSMTVNGKIIEGWRLPTALNQDGTGPDQGYNATGSEMGHLYYTELENIAQPLSGSGGGLVNKGPFTNLQPSLYWSGTVYSTNTNCAWYFHLDYGDQDELYKDYNFYGLAVHSGNVGAPVPIPGAILLFVPGLAGLAAIRRRFKK
jgi:hypothetical protein